jgi:hypothetical protein
MAAKQEFHCHILEDGTITMETGKIASEVHKMADEFKAEVVKLMGGPVETVRKREGVVIEHEHDHEHLHQHE